MNHEIKTCNNCEYRLGTYSYGRCMLSGYYCTTERAFPHNCGREFTGWKPRRSIIIKIKQYFGSTNEQQN